MRKETVIISILAGIFMLTVILDGQTAVDAAQKGVILCLHTVIPSLFPLMFFSSLLRQNIPNGRIFHKIERLCLLPPGSGKLIILGLLGGYPVGAMLVSDAYKNNQLTKQNAERYLGFCNQCGPAFIFGITGALFPHWYIPWCIWFLQIYSALLTAQLLLPKTVSQEYTCPITHQKSTDLMSGACKGICTVCGWILLFRVIIAFLQKWILWLLPKEMQIIVVGVLEMTNGAVMIPGIQSQYWQFVVISLILSLGGFCVSMQTFSVAKNLSCRLYFLGKLLQAGLCFTGSLLMGSLLFHNHHFFTTIPTICLFAALPIIIKKIGENNTGNMIGLGV